MYIHSLIFFFYNSVALIKIIVKKKKKQMFSKYFIKKKKRKLEAEIIVPILPSFILQKIFSHLDWPELIMCQRVSKQWNELIKNVNQKILNCLSHHSWKHIKEIHINEFHTPLVPHGYHKELFGNRAVVVPHDSCGYAFTIKGKKLNTKLYCSPLIRCEKSGISILVLPKKVSKLWSPLHMIQIINTLVHTKLPTIRLPELAGVTHYGQPDLRDALLSFCCPCYIRYLAQCGFFWPHTRKEFKII